MLPDKLAFIDIETTGGRAIYDRIIEIGILRIENNTLVKSFHSLINPQTHLPPEITMLTGITAGDLEHAPTFRQIKDDVLEILSGCFFVAHNVRFDYGFVKNEFKREMVNFSSKHFCTVRLSRLLYPHLPHHNLDSIIEKFHIPCLNRHRALDDAKVLYSFFQKIQEEFPLETLEEAFDKCIKRPSLPVHLRTEDLEVLPEKPGVYIFYGAMPNSPEDKREKNNKTVPLYVGKSVNIHDRVLSHFSSDIRSGIEMKISRQIEHIETITTAGELGALLLESQMIKSLLPLYNRKSRMKRELVTIKNRINTKGYQEAFLESITKINLKNFAASKSDGNDIDTSDTRNSSNLDTFLGFFKSRKQAKNFLVQICQKHSLCEKLLGLEKTTSSCFAYRLGRCKGACTGLEKPISYNLRFLTAFAGSKIRPWPFNGPVIIEEAEIEGKKEYFFIDNWCFLGNVTIDAEGNKKENLIENLTFDLDVYQILKQYLSKPSNIKRIKVMKNNKLPSPQMFLSKIYGMKTID